MNEIEKWINSQTENAGIFDSNIQVIHAKPLAMKIANMSRAEMATMRTYFRKQVNWKPKEAKKNGKEVV